MDLSQAEQMINDLSQRCRVIAFDNRGAGRTGKPDIPYTIAMMAEDTHCLLRALGIKTANVLGISLGGRVALQFALEHPGMVENLILASTSARMAYHRGLLWRVSDLMVRIPAVRSVGTKYPQPYYAYVRQREASRGFDAVGRLPGINSPTLILHGKKDRVVPYALAEAMHEGIAGSELVSFEGGHLFPFREEAEFVDSVSAFVKPR